MKTERVEKLVANLHGKEEYVIHIRNLKQASNLELVLEKVQRIIQFNQKAWLKPFIDMKTAKKKRRKKKILKKIFIS